MKIVYKMYHTREVIASYYIVIRNLSGLTLYHKMFLLNMHNVCYTHSQNNYRVVAVNAFLTFIGACKYILQDVTLQIHFCKTFYVVLPINRCSNPHPVPIIGIVLG